MQMRVFNLSGSIPPIYTQTCAGSTETLQGEGEEKFSPSYQSLSQFQQQEGIRGIALPPPLKDRISVLQGNALAFCQVSLTVC